MNIGLMFVHEPDNHERRIKQKETDKLISNKIGDENILTKFFAWITGTIVVQ